MIAGALDNPEIRGKDRKTESAVGEGNWIYSTFSILQSENLLPSLPVTNVGLKQEQKNIEGKEKRCFAQSTNNISN